MPDSVKRSVPPMAGGGLGSNPRKANYSWGQGKYLGKLHKLVKVGAIPTRSNSFRNRFYSLHVL
jgi:hypothetical protein